LAGCNNFVNEREFISYLIYMHLLYVRLETIDDIYKKPSCC